MQAEIQSLKIEVASTPRAPTPRWRMSPLSQELRTRQVIVKVAQFTNFSHKLTRA